MTGGRQGQTLLTVVLRGSSWNTIGTLAQPAIAILLTPFVIDSVGLERYGLFAVTIALTSFLSAVDGGLGKSAQRYLALYAGQDDQAAGARLLLTLTAVLSGLGALLCLTMYLLAPTIVGLLSATGSLRSDGIFLVRVAGLIVALGFLRGLFYAVLASQQRFALMSMVTVLLNVVYAAAAVVVLQAGFGLKGLIVCLAGQSALAVLLIVIAACRRFAGAGIGLMSWRDFRAFAAFASRVQVVSVITLINLQADALMMGLFLPLRTVGLASAGTTFANQLRTVPIGALGPMITALSRAVGVKGEAAAHDEYERLQRTWVLVCTGWSVVALGVVYFGVTSWLGPGYELAGTVAAIAVAGNMVSLWGGVATAWVAIIGRPGLEVHYALVTLVVNLTLTLALIKPFGAIGVISATAAGQIVGNVYLVQVVSRRLELPVRSFLLDVPVRAAVAGLAATLALEVAFYRFMPQGPLGLVLCGVVGAPGLVVYVLAVFGPRRTFTTIQRRLASH